MLCPTVGGHGFFDLVGMEEPKHISEIIAEILEETKPEE